MDVLPTNLIVILAGGLLMLSLPVALAFYLWRDGEEE
jgi:hypothetical protein